MGVLGALMDNDDVEKDKYKVQQELFINLT